MTTSRVIFRQIKFRNFMGTGNQFTQIDIAANDRNLIIGKNGTGKSQMIDAITFALYNRAFRNINKPDLINTINDKDCLVELEFSVLGISYIIRRGQKPSIFEVYVDGVAQNKTGVDDLQKYLETQVVKMNFKTFCQVVILGSTNYIPFMQLPAAQRREVNESLLDLQTFSVMNVLMKGKVSALKKELGELETDVSKLEHSVSLYKTQIDRLSQDNEGHIMDLQIEIANLDDKIRHHQEQVEGNTNKMNEVMLRVVDIAALENKHSELMSARGALTGKQSQAQQNIQFFEKNAQCPVCAQGIADDHKAQMVEGCTHTITEVQETLTKIDAMAAKNTIRIQQARATKNEIQVLQSAAQQNQSMISQIGNQRRQIEQQIAKLKEPTSALGSAKDALLASESQLVMVRAMLAEKKTQMDHYEVALSLLKDDGIKATILSKYLPIINAQVNAYLGALNFFVGFEMDSTFDVIFKSRFRDKFKYDMFSEGQKARIDLALMMTWRDVAKLKNSVSTNLLVMDEIFDGSLDTEGSEEMLQILNALEGENVWVISHKDLYVEKFDKVYRFVLEDNFSQIQEMK